MSFYAWQVSFERFYYALAQKRDTCSEKIVEEMTFAIVQKEMEVFREVILFEYSLTADIKFFNCSWIKVFEKMDPLLVL